MCVLYLRDATRSGRRAEKGTYSYRQPNPKQINMKVYITKYALTKGILEVEVNVSEAHPSMAVDSENSVATYHKPDWFTTKEEAIARAEQMRMKKIFSLEKSLRKLKELKLN